MRRFVVVVAIAVCAAGCPTGSTSGPSDVGCTSEADSSWWQSGYDEGALWCEWSETGVIYGVASGIQENCDPDSAYYDSRVCCWWYGARSGVLSEGCDVGSYKLAELMPKCAAADCQADDESYYDYVVGYLDGIEESLEGGPVLMPRGATACYLRGWLDGARENEDAVLIYIGCASDFSELVAQ